jgi:drug/metabolite transporter (DMT)-like permease
MVVDDSSAAPFTLLRFGLAALIAAPYTPGVFNNKPKGGSSSGWNRTEHTITAWRWGAEMGFWMFLGFSCQALGLETTTAQRSGFLLYLNVKFVPFFSRFLWGRPISIPTWVSALVAFGGTALLATDGESTIGFNVGDLWSIAAAAASAMYILRLEKAAAMVQDAAQLNSACLWVVASLAAIWTFGGGGGGGGRVVDISETLTILGTTAQSYPWQILYLGAVTTTLANYIQSRGQRYISPERASILYSLDPVYGAFFSWFLLGETIGGVQALVGAGMITAAAATNAFLDFGTKKDEDVPSSSSTSSSTRLME